VGKGAFWSILGASVALMLVMGCGSSGDDSTATASLTKAQFVQRGNALCKEREDERAQAVQAEIKTLKPGEQFSDAQQTKLVGKIIVPSYEKMITNVKGLGAPKGDEAKVEEILSAMEKALKDLKADPEKAVFSTVMFEDANELTTKYGLTTCVI
jgi:hypothetical protein